jgi:hypothetical protein
MKNEIEFKGMNGFLMLAIWFVLAAGCRAGNDLLPGADLCVHSGIADQYILYGGFSGR